MGLGMGPIRSGSSSCTRRPPEEEPAPAARGSAYARPVSEHELHGMWASARWHLIASQVAPTLLLAATVGFLAAGLGYQALPIRIAAALILLSSGVLGFAIQFSAAAEARGIAADLAAIETPSAVTVRILRHARGLWIVTVFAPIVFGLTYLALLWAIFLPPSVGVR
jgi:hypothetical protein